MGIHGWSPSTKKLDHIDFLFNLFAELDELSPGAYNTFAIDWKGGSSGLNYPLAYNNMRVVSRLMARDLIEFG